MEEFIVIAVPIFSVLITALIAALIFKRKITRIDVGVAIAAGMVNWLFGPRCLCIDMHDTLVGSLYFAIFFGVVVFCLFLAACFIWKRIHQR